MTKQSTKKTKLDPALRASRILELVAEGLSERDIASKLEISKTTVHNEIIKLREEAIKGIEDHISQVPFQWRRCVTSFDMLIRRSNELLDSEDADKIALIKLIAELQKTRLDLYSAPEIMKRAAQATLRLKEKIERLQKEQRSSWQFVTEVQQEAGKADKVTRKAVRKKAIVDEGPIV